MTEFSALRKHVGLTIPDLSAQLGLPEDEINAWDDGQLNAPPHVIRALNVISYSLTSDRTEARHNSEALQQQSFAWSDSIPSSNSKRSSRTGAFTDNMKLPIYRWFRYSAGFSAEWVTRVIRECRQAGTDNMLFDPFAGSATSLLAAKGAGVPSAGAERHPFVLRVAQAKLSWDRDIYALNVAADELLALAKELEGSLENSSELLGRCYSNESLHRLIALRSAFLAKHLTPCGTSELLWLAITSILRECSGVGTAQWQYLLPNKSKAKVVDPYAAFQRRILMFTTDINAARRANGGHPVSARLALDDARDLSSFADLNGKVTCVITSPPYPNNFDYADATRLEMTFWGEVSSWGDLHQAVRHQLIRSCSQHTAADKLELEALLDDSVLEPIQDDLRRVCSELAEVRQSRGGKKTYHTMVAAYFADLGRVWIALRRLCATDADICFVIGNSAPYGVYVPVDQWLTVLAESAGFHSPRFEKIRDRNLKWKNRKHRVPLKEGNLWLKG